MNDNGTTLLVLKQDERSKALQNLLAGQGVETELVGSVQQARRTLEHGTFYAAIFADTELADGTWADVLALATTVHGPVPVIVVSRFADTKLYIHALERGAADFIVPPFGVHEVAHVLRCAISRWSKDSKAGGKLVGGVDRMAS
ncbi:MAG TPA: response regulator [Terriglobia bacterium]|nr:response regulator [Terriglobia bacterium]